MRLLFVRADFSGANRGLPLAVFIRGGLHVADLDSFKVTRRRGLAE